jgi:hypothetical protein
MCFDVVGRPQNATASTRNERPQARHQPAPAHGRGGESFARGRRRCAMPAGSLQRGGWYGGRGLADPIERISFVRADQPTMMAIVDFAGVWRTCRDRAGPQSPTNPAKFSARGGAAALLAEERLINLGKWLGGPADRCPVGSPPCNGLSTRYPHIAFRTSEMFAGIILP